MTREWERKKLKYCVDLINEKVERDIPSEQSIGLENIESKTGRITSGDEPMVIDSLANRFREGDILFSKLRPYLAKVVDAKLPGYCTSELLVLRPRLVDRRFLFYALLNPDFIEFVNASTYGSKMPRASWEFIGQVRQLLPSMPEQRAIAAFLDRKTAEIDAVVAKKERLIDLLREERQAVISHAVEARSNRRKAKLSYYAHLLPGYAFASTEFSHDTEDVRLLRGINVTPQGICWEETVYWKKADASTYGDYALQQDDLVFGMDRPKISSGIRVARVRAADLPALLLQRVARLRAAPGLEQDYLELLLRSDLFWAHLEPDMTGVSVPHVSPEQILSFEFWLPTLDEQKSVCRHVTNHLHRIDGLLGKNEQQITKLREYRQSLISAAVTGKLAIAQETVVATPVEPAKKPNPYFRRTVLAAEVIAQLGDDPTFGHVKFQKAFFVAQHHLQLPDFEENYHRMAAGPHDNQMIRSVDSQLKQLKWFAAKQAGGRYFYERLEKVGGHRKYFDNWFGAQAADLANVLNLFRPMKTEQAEIVATLYAAWNDALLLGEPVDDDSIIEDVLSNWHDSKKKITRDRWQTALDWMREKNLIPHGFGKPTRSRRAAEGKT